MMMEIHLSYYQMEANSMIYCNSDHDDLYRHISSIFDCLSMDSCKEYDELAICASFLDSIGIMELVKYLVEYSRLVG